MDNVYTYVVNMPPKVHEFVTPCADGYTIYIDEKLSHDARLKAYDHAMHHIRDGDFDKDDVQSIETNAHTL